MQSFSLHHIFTDLSMRQLRAVAAVAEAGTLAGAAKLLHVTPPAVAQQLHLVEDAAGLPLFDRIEGRMVATEAAQKLLVARTRVESAIADCAAEVSALCDGLGGRVSIGVISTAKYFAPHVLAAFVERHPDIKLQIEVGNRGDVIAALESYAYDMTIMGRPPDDLELVTERIADHPHVVIASPSHPLVGRKKLTFADLASEVFLVRERGSGTRMLVERLLDEAGVSSVERMQIGSNESMKQGVMAGLGIAFISADTIGAEVDSGRLCVLDVAGLPVMRSWFLVRPPDKHLFPAATALWEFIAREASEIVPRFRAVGPTARPRRRVKKRRPRSRPRR